MELIIFFQEMWRLALQGQTQGIWFCAALYAFAVCVYSLIFQIRTRYWPSVPGELSALEVKKFGATDGGKSNQDYVSTALYKYRVSGTEYEGKRISPWIFVASHNARFVLEKQMSSLQRLPDGKVNVFYNPRNPRKSFLIISGKTGICITLSAGVLPLISFYCKYYV